jgi:hypothetical protein
VSLREAFNTDASVADSNRCRLYRWLGGFDGDDRAFLVELLESTRPTARIIEWANRQGLPQISADKMNGHRDGRCTCADDVEGRRGAA